MKPPRDNAPSPESLAVLPACYEDIKILYRDEAFLLIEKPAGLLSVPGRHPQNRDSVILRLQADYPSATMVHRLDYDTSGVMVVPLTPAALSSISKAFQQRVVEKTYTAVVAGLPESDSGEIDLPIAADSENRPKYKICYTTGKPSLTRYEVIGRDARQKRSRLLLHPVTGRSHQLRLHLWAAGYPILGCPFYNAGESALAADRLLLHATSLEFPHPVTGVPVKIHSEPVFRITGMAD